MQDQKINSESVKKHRWSVSVIRLFDNQKDHSKYYKVLVMIVIVIYLIQELFDGPKVIITGLVGSQHLSDRI